MYVDNKSNTKASGADKTAEDFISKLFQKENKGIDVVKNMLNSFSINALDITTTKYDILNKINNNLKEVYIFYARKENEIVEEESVDLKKMGILNGLYAAYFTNLQKIPIDFLVLKVNFLRKEVDSKMIGNETHWLLEISDKGKLLARKKISKNYISFLRDKKNEGLEFL